MTRRILVPALLCLLALAATLAAAVGGSAGSAASFTTSSQTAVTASADTEAAWLHVYSQETDPQGQTGYARRRGLNGVPGPPAATGQDGGLGVDLGDFPDANTTFPFARVFSIRTPDTFPSAPGDPVISQITVTVSALPDPTTNDNMLQTPRLSPFGQTSGGGTSVTLGPGQKYQLNVSVKARKKFALGQTYFPRVRLSITVGGLAGYYTYEFPLQVRDAGGS